MSNEKLSSTVTPESVIILSTLELITCWLSVIRIQEKRKNFWYRTRNKWSNL